MTSPVASFLVLLLSVVGSTRALEEEGSQAKRHLLEEINIGQSCFGSIERQWWFKGPCTYESFLERIELEVTSDPTCANTAAVELQLLLGVTQSDSVYTKCELEEEEDSARAMVRQICVDAATAEAASMRPWTDVTQKGIEFDAEYFDGNTNWNEEVQTSDLHRTPYIPEEDSNILRRDARRVYDVYEAIAEHEGISFPDDPNDMSNFANCELRAAMCCWVADRQAGDNNGNCATPYDTNCLDADPADNTDICYVDMARSTESNHVNGGFALYDGDNADGEGDAHCHGLAWGQDEIEAIARYRGNNLFYISMSDHMYDRGYVRNVPGAPMCACLEQMPVVTRSDCTQLDVKEIFIISYAPGAGITVALDPDVGIEIDFNACQGARRNNDLESYYHRLANEGRASQDELNQVREHLVGNGNCPSRRDAFVETMGFEPL